MKKLVTLLAALLVCAGAVFAADPVALCVNIVVA